MAYPLHLTEYYGVTDTADIGSVTINPLQPFVIGNAVWLNNPWKHQYLTYFMRNAAYEPTKTSKFGHLEDAVRANFVQYTGPDEVAGSRAVTDMVFKNGGKRLGKWGRLFNTRTEEIILLEDYFDSDGFTSGDLERDFGTASSSGQPTLKYDWFKILPPQKPEGEDMGRGRQTAEAWYWFRTGILEYVVEMTGTKAAEMIQAGDQRDPFTREFTKQWDILEDELEAGLIIGGAVDTNPAYATYAHHSMTGLFDIITDVWWMPSIPNRYEVWSAISQWTRDNGPGGAILTSREWVQQINTWAFEKVMYTESVKRDGLDINELVIPGVGRHQLITIDFFSQEPHLKGHMILHPNTGFSYRPLIGSENRDIGYEPVEQDENDLDQGKIFGEVGAEFFGKERWKLIKGPEF